MTINVQGQSFTVSYSGEISGDELHLSLHVLGRPGEERFTFERVNAASPLDRFSEPAAPPEVTA